MEISHPKILKYKLVIILLTEVTHPSTNKLKIHHDKKLMTLTRHTCKYRQKVVLVAATNTYTIPSVHCLLE